MPPRNRQWRFHGLKKPKIRADWNKYNLYNLSRLKAPSFQFKTFFQQKWAAKAATRAYHGEQINEKQWCRMFDRRTPAVVPMSPKALAEDDGSKFSSGRGSGKDLKPDPEKPPPLPPKQMPYMSNVYHPTERRLDMSIFRALFASSARQARQMVVHGHVKVNGKKMIYPGYLLNPGDMFQVDPTMVLHRTGTILLPTKQERHMLREQAAKAKKAAKAVEGRAAEKLETSATSEPEGALESTPADLEESLEPEEELSEEESNVSEADEAAATKKTILFLRAQAVDLEAHPPKGKKLSAKQKQDLRAYRKTLKSSLSKAKTLSPSAVDDLEAEFRTLSNRIEGEDKPEPARTAPQVSRPQDSSLIEGNPRYPPMTSQDAPSFTTDPTDPSNPLAHLFTLPDGRAPPLGPDGKPINPGPRWEPKDYMSAFAFIPRYLEVNQTIMSAVYLRHPVVRPGLAEVPSPFNFETHLLTFGWYLRRR